MLSSKTLMAGIKPAQKFIKILDGLAISELQRSSKKDMEITTNIDGIKEGRRKTENGITITLGSINLVKLNTQCRKLLDFILAGFTEIAPYGEQATLDTVAKVSTFSVRLEDFMSVCGLQDKRNARAQFREAAHTLLNIGMDFDYEIKRVKGRGKSRKIEIVKEHVEGYMFVSTAGIKTLDEEPLKDSRIEFDMSVRMLLYLCNRFIMPVDLKMFTINPQKNPHSYNLMRRLSEYYDMNATAPDEPVRISVRKLLEHCPEIPTPEEIRKEEAGQISKRIREPFERDLEALEETYGLIKWQYCKRRGIEFEPEEKQPANYPFEDWLDLLIEYYLPAYPIEKKREMYRHKKEETA